MRILVCFRTTPDYEALRATDWAALAAGGVADEATKYVRRVLNCFDESALELALRLAEARGALGAATELAALTVAGREADAHLTTLRALGFSRAARVEPHAALDFAPAATAALIAGFARLDRSDVLLLGSRSGPGDSGTVPFRVADALGRPCLTQLTELEPWGEDGVRVICSADDALLRITLRPPCVLAVGNAVVSHLRVPTLGERLARRDLRADVLTPGDLGVDPAAGTLGVTGSLIGLERIDRSRAGVVLPGETPRDAAQALLASHLAGVIGAP
jgi:electron transfer flavoprotein beta subunit